MNTRTFLTLYALSVPIFLAVDMVWLGFIAADFYAQELGYLLGPVNWVAAISFYILFLLGLTFFATYPAVKEKSLKSAVVLGGLFGFFTYATYDLTNLATIKAWPLSVTFIDMAWGTFLGAMVSAIVYFLYTRRHT
jgi:uncharacterized membrane protein